MKVSDISKELGIANKEVISKAQKMGYDVKSHNSNIDDEGAIAVKKAFASEEEKGETKIVKAATRKKVDREKTDDTQHVVVKAAHIDPKVMAKSKTDKQPESSSLRKTSKPVEQKISKLPPEPIPAVANKPSGNAPIPRRIPKEEIAPKRIPRAEIEKEQAILEKEKAGETPEKDKKTLKVPAAEATATAATAAATTVTAAVTTAAADEKKKTEEKTADEKKTVPEKTPVTKSETTKPEPVKESPRKKTAKPSTAGGKGESSTTKKEAPSRSKTSTSSKQERSSDKSQGSKAGDQQQQQQSQKKKDKPKKSHKGKRGKQESGEHGDRIKKKNPRQRNRGELIDDFVGSSKRPILKDNLLEKKPTRSRPRPHKHTEPKVTDEIIVEELAPGTVVINVPITVKGFAEQINKTTTEIIMTLMTMGVMANVNQNIDEDTVLLLGEEMEVPIIIGRDEGEIIEEGLEIYDDQPEDLVLRPPVITVMGHVDHGKTSLLDKIRETHVTGGEAGGITQHIGASEVTYNDKRIVFLDTPGHEAFTAMRARGAHVTDIAILVVAADDSVKPQTIESISHAKAAGVPIIVAINKIDKPGADPDKVKKDLSDNGVLVEDWGGSVISVPVSAKTGDGIKDLLEMILLQAEVLELKANPKRLAVGTVIEARLDKAKGVVASLLVQNGTLDSGISIVAGTTSGRIRAMTDYKGSKLKSVGPATAVEVLGLDDVPQAGDQFNAIKDDKVAREIAGNRRIKQREEVMTRVSNTSLESLFSQIQEGSVKELNLIIKGDVQGSVGALVSSLEKLENENVKIRIIHTGVGTVTESDVMLASTSGAIIIGFNIRPSVAVSKMAENDNVEIRTYRIIYDVINEIEDAMKGMLDPEFREVVLGQVEVRETFKVPGIGIIAGGYVTDGVVQRNAEIRLVRDGIVIQEGKISSLKRFKDDVKEVAQGYECGIGIEDYNDIKIGDIIEAFTMEEIER